MNKKLAIIALPTTLIISKLKIYYHVKISALVFHNSNYCSRIWIWWNRCWCSRYSQICILRFRSITRHFTGRIIAEESLDRWFNLDEGFNRFEALFLLLTCDNSRSHSAFLICLLKMILLFDCNRTL